MALQEYYNTNDDGTKAFGIARWYAQSFTPAQDYDVTSVKLLLYKSLTPSPGEITVNIETVDGSNQPTGVVQCTGTSNGDTLDTDTGGEWREITFDVPASLTSGTMYAIVVKALDATGNRLNWRIDGSGPTYAGGIAMYTLNSGEDWTNITTSDLMFEVYGVATTYSELAGTIIGTGIPSGNLSLVSISELSGTIAAVVSLSGNLGSILVHIVDSVNRTRLVATANDQFWYEDI